MPLKTFDVNFYRPLDPNEPQDTKNAFISLLFLRDSPQESDILSVSVNSLDATATSLTLLSSSDKTASDSNFHFQLYFDPDTLSLFDQVELVPNSQWGLARKVHADNHDDPVPGWSLYLLYTGTQEIKLSPGEAYQLALRKVAGTTTAGTRPGTVKFSWNDAGDNGNGGFRYLRFDPIPPLGATLIPGHGDKYDLNAIKPLDLIGVGGAGPAPLGLFLTSPNVVLNDGAAKNYVSLRLVHLGDVPLEITSSSRFVLSFDDSKTTSDAWALATSDQLGALYIPGNSESSGVISNWSSTWSIRKDESLLTWTVTPQSPPLSLQRGDSLDIPISNLVTGHVIGQSAIHLRYYSLTGYSDGELIAVLQKAPALYRDATLQRLAIGTQSPTDYPLTVDSTKFGIAHTCDVSDHKVELATFIDSKGGWIGTKSTDSLQLYTNNKDPSVTLDTNGNLGIGTLSPQDRVHIAGGDQRIDGNLHLHDKDGNVTVTVNSGGQLGIGTGDTGLQFPLTVNAANYGIAHTNSGITLVTYVDSKGGWIGTKTDNPLFLFTKDGHAQLTLDNTDGNGYVGIGTTTPKQKLHVAGGIRIDGDVQTQDGGKPMICETLGPCTTEGGLFTFKTSYAVNDWVPVLGGFLVGGFPQTSMSSCYWKQGADGKWWLNVGGMSIISSIEVQLLFIRRAFVERGW